MSGADGPEYNPHPRSAAQQLRESAWREFLTNVEPDCAGRTGVDRVGCLVHWSEAVVYNGGRLQYSISTAADHAEEAVEALIRLGAERDSDVLAAVRRTNAHPEFVDRSRPYSELVARHPFDDPAKADGGCEPMLELLLDRYSDDPMGPFGAAR